MSPHADLTTQRARAHWLALLVYPGLWGTLLTVGYLDHKFSSTRGAGVGEGDLAALLFPAVLIYCVTIVLLRRNLRGLTKARALAFSVCAAALTVASLVLGVVVTYRNGNGMMADRVFFYVLPFAPPILAIGVTYWLVVARRPRQAESPT